jgi:hypothetical protein
MSFGKKNVIVFLTCAIVLCYLTIFRNQRSDSQISIRGFTIREKRVFNSRSEITNLLIKFGYKTMIEIGVRDGEYACQVLEKWTEFEHYYGIDAFLKQSNYIDWANKEQATQDEDYLRTLNLLNTKFGKDKVTLVRNFSTNAASQFKKESIDFVYIDARHDYCGTTEDMDTYFPILKCGGLFAGHDYGYNKASDSQDWGVCANGSRIEGSVKRAVLEFAERNVIPLIQIAKDSWFFFKEC